MRNSFHGDLFDRFTISKLITGSGHSTDYQAKDTNDGALVRLKILRPYFSENREGVSRFFEEIKALQNLNHPTILSPSSFGQNEDQVWIASEGLSWKTLSKVVENGSLTLDLIKQIVTQLAVAIDSVHFQGITHGGLDPNNILVSDSGEIKIVGFGIAGLVNDLHLLLRTSIPIPNPHFTAPEQLRTHEVSNASDIYSMGVLIYEMITGQLPFASFGVPSVLAEQTYGQFSLPSSINPVLGIAIDQVISQALAVEPDKRFTTAIQLQQAATKALDSISEDISLGVFTDKQTDFVESTITDKAEEPTGSGSELIYCPSCGQPNDASLRYCQKCWNLMAGRQLPTNVEAQRLVRTISREWRRSWLLRRGILVGSILVPVLWVLSLFVSFPVAKPDGNANAVSGEAEWVTHGRDFNNTSYIKDSKLVDGNLLWKFETNLPLETSPTADDIHVYLTTGDKRVVALNIEDGSVAWEKFTPTPVDSTPVVTEEAIYFGMRNGEIWALDILDGAKLWSFQTGNPVFGSAQVYQGVVYIGSGDGFLYALDALTGEKLWDYEVGGWVLTAPVLYQNFVAVATSSGWVWVIDIKNGRKRLSYKTAGSIIQDPVSVGDKIIAGNFRGKLVAIDWNAIEYPGERGARYYRAISYIWGLESKAPIQKGFIWSNNFGRSLGVNSPAIADNFAYVVTTDGKLRSVDVNTGKVIWSYDSNTRIRNSSPAVGGNVVYMGTDNGFVHSINRSTGEEINRFFVGGGVVGQLIIANDSIFVASNDGSLYAFR